MATYVKSGEAMAASWANDVVSDINRLQRPTKKRTIMMGNGSNSGECAFGTIVTSTSGSFIKGGIVYAGDKNFNVANKELDLDTDMEKLIYFEIPVTCNMDDDNEIILPAIKTSTWDGETWEDISVESGYPDNTAPTIPSGVGKIIVPLGKLIIVASESSAEFESVGCGNILIDQCSGTLSHKRQ